MNRRRLVMAGLAAIPASMLAVPALAGPNRKPRGRAGQAAVSKRAARTPAHPKQAALRPARQRFKIVTRNFLSTELMSIPDSGSATPYPTTLRVSDLPSGKLLKVNLILYGFTHTFPADVDVMLVAPNGRGAVVMSDVVGRPAPGTTVDLTFDDQALGPPPAPLVTGTYQPTNSGVGDVFPAPAPAGPLGSALAVFIGSNPNGLWKLYVNDDAATDVGTIAGWGLRIRAKVKIVRQPKPKPKAKAKNQARNQAKANRGQHRPRRRRQ